MRTENKSIKAINAKAPLERTHIHIQTRVYVQANKYKTVKYTEKNYNVEV